MKSKMDFSTYAAFSSQEPFDFAKHSSIGCGNRAPIVFYPTSVLEWAELLQRLQGDGIPYYTLGNLTNVLPPDKESHRAIISTKKLDGVVLGERLFAYAGVRSGSLLRVCKREGLSGAEFLSGIPCTVGGALFMNAGAGDKYISEIVDSVQVLRGGKRYNIPLKDCQYGYKSSVFMQNGDSIVGAYLRLEKTTEKKIVEREQYYIERRKHLPKGRSMGCVFKNPEGVSAGALIEGSGLKGLRVGGARISTEHANFILNEKGATARDIRAVITIIKNAVWAQYGVLLEEEIRYLD